MKIICILLLLFLVPSAYAQDKDRPSSTKATVIEGSFAEVSKLPRPEGNPYPDCYYTATIDVTHIVSGPSIPQKIVL